MLNILQIQVRWSELLTTGIFGAARIAVSRLETRKAKVLSYAYIYFLKPMKQASEWNIFGSVLDDDSERRNI